MNISIFGMGYVGCVSAACLAKLGHHVIGNDVSERKVRLINQGKPTVVEAEIDGMVRQAHERGMLEATTDYRYAVQHSDLSFIAVGTPGSKEGHPRLSHIYDAASCIGEALADKPAFHIIVIRSTALPGTNAKVRGIIAEKSGKVYGKDFAVVTNPEFLREGSAVQDYLNPPLTLIGTDNEAAEKKLRELYKDIPGEFICTDIEVAEIMKYVNNTFHGLKIVFANEVGNICKALGIDSHKVMEIFCRDRQSNISPRYLMPGFAYGGSCLPKDIRALAALAHDLYLNTPVLQAIPLSNEQQKKNAVDLIESKGRGNIGILGLSFKAGTDDLRCSPMAEVAQTLYGRGYTLRIYDRNVAVSLKNNINAGFIKAKLPNLYDRITDDLDAVCAASDVLVIANKEKEFGEIPRSYPHKVIVDLAGQYAEMDYEGNYEGLSWAAAEG